MQTRNGNKIELGHNVVLGVPFDAACMLRHVGCWLIEPNYLRARLAQIRAGFAVSPVAQDGEASEPPPAGGLAVIPIIGPMSKGDSKFGGANTLAIRRAVREAAASAAVGGIMLHIDSPGGQVAGTDDLAQDVRLAAAAKPLYAQIVDLGASAAYWVASQASRVFATRSSEIGSLGVLAVIEDTSKAAEMAGVTVHVVSTGPFKGLGVDGAPVSAEHVGDIERRVLEVNALFKAAVHDGRKLATKAVDALFDGRMHSAASSLSLGLIDEIGDFAASMAALQAKVDRNQRRKSTGVRTRLADFS